MSTNDNDNATTPDDPMANAGLSRPRHCYSRFWIDLTGTCRCAPSFRPSDIVHRKDGSSKIMMIDFPSSFSPPIGMLPATATKTSVATATALVAIWKLLVLTVELTAMMLDLVVDPNAFWLAYLTNWALLFTMVYSTLSLFNTIIPVSAARPASSSSIDDDGANDVVSIRIRFTWAFFTLSAVLQMVVTIMFWLLVYESGTPAPSSILRHGVVYVLVWFDGLVVNRIPVRLRHWVEIVLPVILAYVVWTVLQSPVVFEVENPYKEDDQIYSVLDWSSSPATSVQLVSYIIFGVSPIAHLTAWALSLVRRRYVSINDDIVIADREDDEEVKV